MKLIERIKQHPQRSYLRFTLATCLLHLERYDDAIVAYDQAMTKDSYYKRFFDEGLQATHRHQKPDWDNL